MADIMIHHERSAGICQNGTNSVCQVVLTDGTHYISRGKNGEHIYIKFNRKRVDQNCGFKVELFDSSGGMTTHETKNGSPVEIPVPTVDEISTYYYKIYYPWDPAGITVLPLDPVIIIEPRRSGQLTQMLLPALVGAAIAAFACYVLLT